MTELTKARVAGLADIAPGTLKRVVVGDVPVCLARLEDGEVFAIHDTCTHEDIELSDGDLQGCEVECPMHGSRFDVRTGEVSGLPADRPVQVFPASVDGDDIFVEI
jgi:3-phenylpropionate/trans-cinnamate dioxygenase ferredoxin subunit